MDRAKPIQLRRDQNIVLAEGIDGGLELLSLGNAADLLGEYLPATCCL
jgi:hypothetical protein